jgi:class 3 adenylate cyclase
VGDTVNLSQRLQQLAAAGETVLSQATTAALTVPVSSAALPAQLVKGRDTPIVAYKIAALGLPAPAALRNASAGLMTANPAPPNPATTNPATTRTGI